MMASKNSGLGRGLGELFRPTSETHPKSEAVNQPVQAPAPQTPDPEVAPPAFPDGSTYREIPLAQIRPNPQQPRSAFDEEALTELADSIKEIGVLQPVVVRQVADGYELIMGERRLRACGQAGLATIPAIVRGTDDTDMLRDALLENLHRAQLNPLEEAAAYQQLLEDFACTKEELASRIKRSRPQISNTLRLLNLPTPVQRRVAAGILSAGHARALLALDDPLEQERLAQRVVAEGLSVRSTEEIVTLGRQGSQTTSHPRQPRPPSADAVRLQEQLTDHFDTRVKVSIGRNRGRIVIEFGDGADLERVLRIIDPAT